MIQGKLYIVTTWCREQNRIADEDQDKYVEGMCIYYYNTGRGRVIEEGEIVLYLGEEEDSISLIDGMPKRLFLYEGKKYHSITAVVDEYYNKVLTLATQDSVKRYRKC